MKTSGTDVVGEERRGKSPVVRDKETLLTKRNIA